jgi:hypothetical protein
MAGVLCTAWWAPKLADTQAGHGCTTERPQVATKIVLDLSVSNDQHKWAQ